MRIVIVGPGALGSLLTARLFIYQQKVEGTDNDLHSLQLLDYRPERAEMLHTQGLIFESAESRIQCSPEVSADPGICADSDIIFLCVKSTAVHTSLKSMAPFLSDRIVLIAMQNGIGHLEEMMKGDCSTAVGITSEGANLVRPGHVRHGGSGLTRLGMLAGQPGTGGDVLHDVAGLLNSAGMDTKVVEDPMPYIWAKLFVNAGINALTALHECRNGELLSIPAAMKQMEGAVKEAEKVARAKGVTIETDPFAATISVCRNTFNNISSMFQDVQRKRQTEIDAINGAIVAEGKKLGIATPVNAELVRRIKVIEESYV